MCDKTLADIIVKQNEILAALQAQIQDLQCQQKQPSHGNVHVPWPAPLDVVDGNLEDFKASWSNYETATGMIKWGPERDQQRASLLLNAIGQEACKKFLFDITEKEKLSQTLIFDKLDEKLKKKKNIIYSRYLFNSRCQEINEKFDTFLIELQRLIKVCEYGAFESDLLRDRIVIGVSNKDLKKEMLRTDKLTLEIAINMCRSAEAASDQILVLDNPPEVNKLTTKKEPRMCKFCGTKHYFDKKHCPAYGKKCENCNGWNHNAKMCKKKHKVKEIQEGSESESELIIEKIVRDSRGVQGELLVKVNDNLKPYLFQLDTGAQMCIIGKEHCMRMLDTTHLPLLPPKSKLSAIGGHPLKVHGDVILTCYRKNTKYKIRFSVVDIHHGPLLSENACVKLGFIKYCNIVKNQLHTINKDGRLDALKLLESYSDVFEGYGQFSGETTIEVDEAVQPSIQPPRRIPMALRNNLKQELERLENANIITKETEHTAWVNNILIIKRKDKYRICLDPVPLNKAIKRPNYQFTTLDEILPELGKAKVFSTVDTKKGFWHVNLTEESSKLTTFWTPFGRYRWKRLPFGISSAPEIFQQKLAACLSGLSGIEVMADDILIYGIGETMELAIENHNNNLKMLLQRLRAINCKLNKDKLNLLQTSVKFFGHILTDSGLQPDYSKVEAIKNMPAPTCKKDVLRFLGMVTYLSRYIRNLSCEARHLRELTYKDTSCQWTKCEEDEFQKLKDIIGDLKSLKYYEVNKPVIMECDASNYGLGVALYQDDKVIAYASRTLTETEKRYAQIEKEMLAVVFGCIRFDQYLNGSKKTIVKTDHKPLLNIFRKPLCQAPKRLQLMLMTLQKYDITLEFVSGINNNLADTLSRSPIPIDNNKMYNSNLEDISKDYKIFEILQEVIDEEHLNISDNVIEQIRSTTKRDGVFQALITLIINGFPRYIDDMSDELKVYFKYKHELSTKNNIIFRNGQILIPECLRKVMLNKLHASHCGVENTLRLARQNVFWPGMSKQIIENVKACTSCLKYAPSQRVLPMKSHEIPQYPFQSISMDVFEVKINGISKKYLITIDHYSDFFELDAMKDLSSSETIGICKKNFSRYGVPQKVVTDGATNFVNQDFRKFAEEWQFKHVTSSPHYPQSNGKAEATVKIAKNLILKAEEGKEDFWYALLHQRNVPTACTNASPAQKFFCRRTRTSVPVIETKMKQEVIEGIPQAISGKQMKSEKYYNKKAQNLPPLHVGQTVFVKIYPEMEGKWYSGSIKKRISSRSYLVDVKGRIYRRNRAHIKPYTAKDNLSQRATPTYQPPRLICDETGFEVMDSDLSQPRVVVEPSVPRSEVQQSAASSYPVHPLPPPSIRPRRTVQPPGWLQDYVVD